MKLFGGGGGRQKPPLRKNENSEEQVPEISMTVDEITAETAAENQADTKCSEYADNASQDSGEASSEESAPEDVSEPQSLRGRVKRTIIRFAVMFVFLFIIFIGLIIVLYPYISNYVNTKNASYVLDGYSSAIKEMSETDYTEYLEAARAYNARLAGSGTTVKDAFGNAMEDENRKDIYWSLLDVSDRGMMGYVEISILDIKLPLYHGVSEVVLEKGAGHIQGSSLPVGGESTHAVISAHTGLPRAKLFTGVDTLKNGDTFTLHILNEVLTYEVNQVLTVLPHDVEALAIKQGEDYVTLVTCTPYGINSHRLLVRGTRIETPPEEVKAIQPETPEAETQEPGWFKRTFDNIVVALAFVVEKVAQGIVSFTERIMDLFGVEY